MRILFALILLTPTLAFAQSATSDAFGIVPTDALSDERRIWAGLRSDDNGQIELQPAGDAKAAIIIVGPKSIVAGVEDGHGVLLALDAHGNMLDGAPTTFVLGDGTQRLATSNNGIADILFRPAPKAGVFQAGATVDGVQSARADYRVTANLATVTPDLTIWDRPQTPETFASINTRPLIDAYGNQVDDGVSLTSLWVDDKERTTLIPATVRDGMAQGVVLTREISGKLDGQIALAGNPSPSVLFEVAPFEADGLTDIRLWPLPAINAIRVRIGPLSTQAGYVLPDGTALQVNVSAAQGRNVSANGWALDGYFEFTVPLPPDSGPFDVSVATAFGTQMQNVQISGTPDQKVIRGAE